ncbi:hypothetical protein [Mycobacterium sp. 1423905.2]|uniref:hypothetical protein n=1 Tax=Mycobacterium sp. 1423905.2 TaxID=1856859 RepID=UPI00352AD764
MSAKLPPARVARAIETARHHLAQLHRRLVPPPVAMMEMVVDMWAAQAIVAAADLGIADALADGPCRPTSSPPRSTPTPTRCVACCGR